MTLSNCTIPHSGHGYVLEMTEDPGALTAISPVGVMAGAVLVGAGIGCVWVIAVALCVSVLKKSLATKPGSAAPTLALGVSVLCVSALKKSLALKPGSAALV